MILYDMFTDGLILQANRPIRIFGEGGGTARVEFCGLVAEMEASTAKWMVELPPLDYGGPYEMHITLNGRETVLHDVYMGDTYLIAGQSNMQFKLHEAAYPAQQYADNALLRVFSTNRISGGDYFTPKDGWVPATKENDGKFSALGYLFGQMMQEKTGHAVGLVTLYQGAAAIQCFLPPSVFTENPALVIPEEKRYDMIFPWNAENGIFYRFGLQKIAPFSFGSVVWYQGESNASVEEAAIYDELLRQVLRTWRLELQTADLPFVVIQIHDFIERDWPWWHQIQQAQADVAAADALAALVVTRDVCEQDLIHPLHKTEVAARIADALCTLQEKRSGTNFCDLKRVDF